MKIKEDCEESTDDFWYALCNGYLKPEKMLENENDLKQVLAAVETLKDFQDSCEEQIEDFYR